MNKITGDEPINQTRGNFGALAYKLSDKDIVENKIYAGLTIRQYFSIISKIDPEESFKKEVIEKIMGAPPPQDPIENINYWDAFEARRKTMKADALIAELNKTTI